MNGGEDSRHGDAVLDETTIESLRELGRRSGTDLVSEIVELFLRIAPERVNAIRSGVDRSDTDAVERAAHALKSSAGNLGATALASSCALLETEARAGHADGMRRHFASIESELARVVPALERLAGRTPTGLTHDGGADVS